MQKAGKKLSYLPTPNMAGLFDDPIPQAPAPDVMAPVLSDFGAVPVPSALATEPVVRAPAPARTSPSKPPPAQPRRPAVRPTVRAPAAAKSPKAIRPTPTTMPSVVIPEYAEPVRQMAAPAPRTNRAPKPAPTTDTVRPKPVVSMGERIRRTLRIPKHFDKMLRDIAKQLGANLNSAILSVIEAEWNRRVAVRNRG